VIVSGLVIVEIAWIAAILLPLLIILGEFFFGTNADDSSVDADAQRKAGLVIVRIAWITAILVPTLLILSELFSGSDGGDSSQPFPDVASALPVGLENSNQTPKTGTAQDDRGQQANEQAPGDSRLAVQPGDAGERVPVITPGPESPQAPAPQPSPAPRPKPSPEPPPSPAPSQPPAAGLPAAPVQTTVTIANNNGPVGDP
jgi:hypothetical protein